MLGIFDSGSGGLTVLKEIKKISPNLNIVYLADFKNIPYGCKSPEEIGSLTVSAIERLLNEGAENIVSACNSVSTSVAQPLIELFGEKDFGMIEMVGPTLKVLTPEAKEGKKILLVATEATVHSGIYSRGFSKSDVQIQSIAIPDLVPAIEKGALQSDVHTIIADAIKDAGPFDILLLGCTQYPLVADIFKEVLLFQERNACVFNPAEAVSKEVGRRFDKKEKREKGSVVFLLSAKNAFFEERARSVLGKEFSLTIRHI